MKIFNPIGVPLSIRFGALLATFLAPAMLRAQEETVFEDDFEAFELGETWKPHGVGEPDVGLGVVGLGEDGSSLRMSCASGEAGETVGIETAPVSLGDVQGLRVEARFRPLNQTAAGDGGASDASVGLAIVSESGAFARVSAGANRPEQPDWGDFYSDSEGSADINSPSYIHFPPNDPDGSAESFRTHVLEITAEGTRLTTLSSGGEPLENNPFDVFNPNLTLSDFGESVRIALFQFRGDETSAGDIDHVKVGIVRDAAPLLVTEFALQESGPNATATVTFVSNPAASYKVEASPNLTDWIELTDGLESQGETTSFVEGDIPPTTAERYYRVREEGA